MEPADQPLEWWEQLQLELLQRYGEDQPLGANRDFVLRLVEECRANPLRWREYRGWMAQAAHLITPDEAVVKGLIRDKLV